MRPPELGNGRAHALQPVPAPQPLLLAPLGRPVEVGYRDSVFFGVNRVPAGVVFA